MLNVATAFGRGALFFGFSRLRGEEARHEQVHVDTDQALGSLTTHGIGDGCPLIAALGDVPGVAQAAHEFGPGPRDTVGVPSDLSRFS